MTLAAEYDAIPTKVIGTDSQDVLASRGRLSGAPGQTRASRYTDEFGPNVSQILTQASRVIRGRVPRAVRAELMAAVKAGVLGRLKKDGLKPEIFFHPDHKNGAKDRQSLEAAYAVGRIATVVAHGSERAEYDFEVAMTAARRERADDDIQDLMDRDRG